MESEKYFALQMRYSVFASYPICIVSCSLDMETEAFRSSNHSLVYDDDAGPSEGLGRVALLHQHMASRPGRSEAAVKFGERTSWLHVQMPRVREN
jgi:hypothetical protein